MFGQEITDGVMALRSRYLRQGYLCNARELLSIKEERPLVFLRFGATSTGVKGLENKGYSSLVSLGLCLEICLARFIMCNHLLKEGFLESLLSQLKGGRVNSPLHALCHWHGSFRVLHYLFGIHRYLDDQLAFFGLRPIFPPVYVVFGDKIDYLLEALHFELPACRFLDGISD